MGNDYSFVYGLLASVFLVIFSLYLAKSFKHNAAGHKEQKQKEKETEIFSLAKDDELTPEEKERLIEVLSKKL